MTLDARSNRNSSSNARQPRPTVRALLLMNGSALSAPHGAIGVKGFDAGRSPISVSAVPASGARSPVPIEAYWRSSGSASSLSIVSSPARIAGSRPAPGTHNWMIDRQHRPNRPDVERIAGVDRVAAQQSHAVLGVGRRYRGSAIGADAGRSPVDVTSSAELCRDPVRMPDRLDRRWCDRDLLATLRERHHVGDGGKSVKRRA